MNTKELEKFTNTKKIPICYPYLEEIRYLINHNASTKAILDYLSEKNVSVSYPALSSFIQNYIVKKEKENSMMDILFDQAFYSAKRMVKNLHTHEKTSLQDLVQSFAEQETILTIDNTKKLFLNFINSNQNSCHEFIYDYINDYFSKIECYVLISNEKDNNE